MEVGGTGGGGFWSPSNIHTVVEMSAIPNLLKATPDLSRTQPCNERFRAKRVHPNEEQTSKRIP